MNGKETHHQCLGRGLDLNRREEKYVDFTIISHEGTRHPCHRVVLAAVSPYFDTMFGVEMKETQEKETEIQFSGETVELILQYIYTGKNVITVESVPDLYAAANYLQISTLQNECEEFLQSNRDPSISLNIWQTAKLFERFDIAEIAKGNVLQNFDIFCNVDSIGETSFDNLKELLLDKFTNCSGCVKCKAAWIWFVVQDNPDLECATNVLNALVSSENVEGSDICEACENDLDQLLTKGLSVEVLNNCGELWRKACEVLWIHNTPTTSGVDMSLNECLIVLGGDPLEESKLTLFNYKKRQWYDVMAPVTDLGHRYAICSMGSFLYLSGGLKNPKAFLCFQADSKVWTPQTELPVGREQHVMCTVPCNTVRSERRVVNRKIYVLGGTSKLHPDHSLVHCYDTARMVWQKCGNIATPVTGACSAVVDQKIYLLGGVLINSGSTSPSDCIQCFDTESCFSWTVESKLPIKAKAQKMSVVRTSNKVLNDDVYVIYGGKIYKLTLGKKNQTSEELIAIRGAPSKGFGAASFGDRIFLFGGEDNNFKITKNILQYDTTSGQAITLPSHTPFSMKDFVCCDIPVPNSWDLKEYDDN